MHGIYGRAATGLQDSSWAINEQVARIGAKGEEKSARLLDGFSKKAAILHDLRIPIPGFKANIDHIVVSGNRVLILDSKMWRPGFYWTMFGVNRRGLQRVDHTAKDQSYVRQAITSYLAGTGARVAVPYLVVWSSREGQSASTWMLKVPGAGVISGMSLVYAVKTFIGRKPANPDIVNKLRQLLVQPGSPARPPVPAAAPLGRDTFADDDPFAAIPSRTPVDDDKPFG